MEAASIINTIIQIVANCVGFVLFFMLLKSQFVKNTEVLNKTVDIVNDLWRRVDLIENNQMHMKEDFDDVREKIKGYRVKYPKHST